MSPVKPPRVRPTRVEVRDRILDAAAAVFAAEGFAGATIDTIGQAAGFTKGAVYSNFKSKDDLFLALLDREFERRGELVATALHSGGGDAAAVAQTLSRSMLGAIHDHIDYQVLLVEYWLRAVRDPQLREQLIARRRSAVDHVVRVVESATAIPSSRALTDLAQLVVTINMGIAMDEVLRPGTVTPESFAHLIHALLESEPAPAD